jgi:hypothetical protein
MTDTSEFILSLTIFARSAYFLAIAENLFEANIDESEFGYAYGQDTLKHAWEWVGGETFSADDLYFFVENESNYNLANCGAMSRGPSKQIKMDTWDVVTLAVGHVCWRAFKMEGARYLPQSLEIIDDDMMSVDLLKFAEDAGGVNKDFLQRLRKYLSKNYTIKAGNEVGNPVSRDELMRSVSIMHSNPRA